MRPDKKRGFSPGQPGQITKLSHEIRNGTINLVQIEKNETIQGGLRCPQQVF